ncbi:MAG: large subunit ribosomal protein L24 [archaeon GW2011_AR5]|nr:large subunit ribosomal protein L24 [uncultured archaeon]KHO48309.1 MAG: large subunit ribosomal protein L24 [archaeon GW2011_AR5]
MKEFSVKWISSKQPRKQRKYRYNAPMHVRQRLVSAHLEKMLRKEYGKRSLTVRKGDEVRIMTGQFRGTRGKVSRVDMKALKVYVENAKMKKVSGQEVEVAIDPSNIMITKLNFDDKRRRKFIIRKGKKQETKETGGKAKGK